MRVEIAEEASFARPAEDLARLALSERPEREFWTELLKLYCEIGEAERAVLFMRPPENGGWNKLADYSTHAERELTSPRWNQALLEAAQEGEPIALDGRTLAGVRLVLLSTKNHCVAVFIFPGPPNKAIREALDRLRLAAAAPSTYQLQQQIRRCQQDVERFSKVIDLLVPVNESKSFGESSLALCNAVASTLHCDRASLGWHEGGFLRLKSISRMDEWDRKMAAAQSLEAAMDETWEQDEEILWPRPEDSRVVAREHERLSQQENGQNLCSLPIRHLGKPVGALVCQRKEAAFNDIELRQLRLACDLIGPRLADLQLRDRWFGAKLASSARDGFSRLLGPEKTWAKLLALLGFFTLLALIFVRVPYRVEGEFTLRARDAVYLNAPFDGYLEEAFHQAGDVVKQGEPLLRLQTDELKLVEAEELANVHTYTRQAERARASNMLAEMQIAQAQAAQAQARLDLVRYRLQRAEIKAPFDGVIIEGDLREMRGRPVAQKDVLFRLAKLEGLFIEARIPEDQVHELSDHGSGEIAFLSQPKLKFPIKVTALEPAALPRDKENLFILRADPAESPRDWWRPGMTGLAKINVENRSLLWIFTRRTVNFLRMFFWW